MVAQMVLKARLDAVAHGDYAVMDGRGIDAGETQMAAEAADDQGASAEGDVDHGGSVVVGVVE